MVAIDSKDGEAILQPPMSYNRWREIEDHVYGVATEWGVVTRIYGVSQFLEDGILSIDWIPKDGHWVEDESFSPYEDDT